jgi:hypothetical protein
VQNWWLILLEAQNTSTRNTCSELQECRTFAEVYGDGRTLCNTIWDTGYLYSEDENNCFVFDTANNFCVNDTANNFCLNDTANNSCNAVWSSGSSISPFIIKNVLPELQ